MLKGRDLLICTLIFFRIITGQAFFEDFNTLSRWQDLYFPGIAEHSTYSLISENENSVLLAEAHNAASGLILEGAIDLYETPWLSWRWKIDHVLEKGDVRSRDKDDYALRIYVLFPFNPHKAGVLEKLKLETARLLFGEYPPQSSLNYIWTNHAHEQQYIPNAYTAKSMMILLESTADRAGTWIAESVNLIDDYRTAFGVAPPALARLVIMSDSDNTGGIAKAYLDYVRLSQNDPRKQFDVSKQKPAALP